MATLMTGFVFISPTVSAQQGRVSSLPLPRFVSLRTEPVNMRTGPGVRYPVMWVYQRRNLPVEITDEFDTWRQIRDPDGEEGWVHQSMLSGQRTGLVTNDTSFRCPKQTELCLVEANGTKGWLHRDLFWGLYEDESVD